MHTKFMQEHMHTKFMQEHKGTKNYVQTKHEVSDKFETTQGVGQGCILSQLLFSLVLNKALKEAKRSKEIQNWILENARNRHN